MKSFAGAILSVVVAVLLATYGADAQQGASGQAAQGQGAGQGRGGGTQNVVGGGQGQGGGQGRGGGGGGRGFTPAGTAPRSAAGRVLLGGQNLKEKGVWLPNFGIFDPIASYKTVPFQPWAKAVYDDRQKHELEPHTRCKPSGTARQFLTPYGVEFVELPEAQRVYIFDIGGPHTFRTIYMDGRSHPADFTPTYYGHSIGWWEGDTLVVDSIGYNERFWLDRRGLPHTDKMHTIERFTRTHQNAIDYQITVDDPGAYTAPWTGKFNLRWEAGTELFEYMCQQANYATELMVGDREAVGKTTNVVP
jgi:hypothetical protein